MSSVQDQSPLLRKSWVLVFLVTIAVCVMIIATALGVEDATIDSSIGVGVEEDILFFCAACVVVSFVQEFELS